MAVFVDTAAAYPAPHGTTYHMCVVSWAVWPKILGRDLRNKRKWILFRVFFRPTLAASPSDKSLRINHSDLPHDTPEDNVAQLVRTSL